MTGRWESFATNPKVISQVLTNVHRVISTFLIKRARMTVKSHKPSQMDTHFPSLTHCTTIRHYTRHTPPTKRDKRLQT